MERGPVERSCIRGWKILTLGISTGIQPRPWLIVEYVATSDCLPDLQYDDGC